MLLSGKKNMTLAIGNVRALVVDDHMTTRTEIEKVLRGMGCKKVDLAASTEEALDKLENGNSYDIIFSDLKMPGKSGYDLMLKCRQNKGCDHTAIIAVSAESEERYIIDALHAGATSYIVKPPEAAKIQEHVNKALGWIEQRRAENG